jgi:NAD-dependent DNA ligase
MADYFKYTVKSRVDKAINTLLGLLQGIAADRTINDQEIKLLTDWVNENNALVDRHPYNELIPKIAQALSDGIFTEGEQEDLVWFCNQWQSNLFYNDTTSDIQQLQGILAAVASDGVVSAAEADKIMSWIGDHDDLRSCYPYDEVDSLLTSVLKDNWIDPQEQNTLMEFFSTFLPESINLQSQTSAIKTVAGICSIAPEISFDGRCFCFTGESERSSREDMKIIALERGARVVADVSPNVNYLVVGSKGNPCWAYSCYGRKIEKAMQLRKKGTQIVIVHEVDYFDAIS